MKCTKCGNEIIRCGAPHDETIKTQYECDCGNIECEYYSPEELERNRRIEAGEDARTIQTKKPITNSTEAKELLMSAATALSSQWSPVWIAKLNYLAEQIEFDLGANEDFTENDNVWRESFLKNSERIDELIKERDTVSNSLEMFIKLQRRHLCPECKTVWRCFEENCTTSYEMLCREHDTTAIREKLGGKWAKWVEVKI